jgi:hypothetical protein
MVLKKKNAKVAVKTTIRHRPNPENSIGITNRGKSIIIVCQDLNTLRIFCSVVNFI